MSKKIDELRSKVASLKDSTGTVLKVADLEDTGLTINVTTAENVTGNYGEQKLIIGTIADSDKEDLKVGAEVRLYLNNRRQAVFEAAYNGEGEYTFLFGKTTVLKNGFNYIPLEAVVGA